VDYITAAFVLHNMVILNGGTMWEVQYCRSQIFDDWKIIHIFIDDELNPLLLQDGELERPIRQNEVLGGLEDQDDDPDDPNDPIYQDPVFAADEELILAAEERGIERRNFIMDHILVLDEDE